MSKDTSMRAPTGDSGAVNPCTVCRLRSLPIFHPPTEGELELIQSLKRREVRLRAGETLIAEGQTDAPLYTLLSGWAFRFKTLADGRRQILNVLLAGDFIGVQQKLSDAAVHGVTALTDSTYCVFQRDALWEIHTKKPALGFDVTWLTAHEESLVDEQLLSVGRRSALERVATLLVMLFMRAAALRRDRRRGMAVPFPLTQQHIADALGLSLVHTNRTLRRLERLGLHELRNGQLRLHNVQALARVAALYGDGRPPQRPLI